MEISLAAVADYANTTADGKLNLMGVFDRINAPAFPARHGALVFAFRARFDHTDQKQTYVIDLRLLDQEGTSLFQQRGEVQVPAIQVNEFRHSNFVFNLVGTTFNTPGVYRFRIAVEEADLEHFTLFQVVGSGKR